MARKSGMAAGKPYQKPKRKTDGQGHDAAQWVFRIRMMVAVDQKDEVTSHRGTELEMEDVAVCDIFEKNPDQQSRQKACYHFPA